MDHNIVCKYSMRTYAHVRDSVFFCFFQKHLYLPHYIYEKKNERNSEKEVIIESKFYNISTALLIMMLPIATHRGIIGERLGIEIFVHPQNEAILQGLLGSIH